MEKELVYSYTLKVTGAIDFGCGLDSVMKGDKLPDEGVRVDISFEGQVDGRVKGTLGGTDYLYIRPDRRMELNIHAILKTEKGANAALHATGVALPKEGPVLFLKENASWFSSHPDLKWLNTLQIWAEGEVNLAEGSIKIKGYKA